MVKPLAIAGLAGLIGLSFSDSLKAGVVLPPTFGMPSTHVAIYGDEGGGGDGRTGDTLWAPAAEGLFHLAHGRGKHGFAGGEGGEGGEGHGHRHHIQRGHYDYRHPYGREPVFAPAALPAVAVPCGTRSLAGVLGGAAAGGFLGSKIGDGRGQLAAVAAGTVLGAFLGREVGGVLEATDVACADYAAHQAYRAPVGQEIVWNNPRTGHSGTLIPLREGRHAASGRYCREYQQTVTVGGRVAQAYGTACRQPDGSWEIVQ